MNVIDQIEAQQMRSDHPDFRVGDTIKVHVRIIEGERERTQLFEGVVIARKHGGVRETITVRRISFGVGVERIFPLHSPRLEKIEVVKQGLVRRAKLYYLRERRGKAARVKSKILRKGEGRKGKKKAAPAIPETPPEPESLVEAEAAAPEKSTEETKE